MSTLPSAAIARRIRRAVIVAVATVAVVSGAALTAAPASAATIAQSSGRPGAVSTYAVQGSQSQGRLTLYGPNAAAQLVMPTVVVGRSPATSGGQAVGYVATIWRWTGSAWTVYATSPMRMATIPAGQSAITMNPVLTYQPPAGYYSVEVGIAWSSGGVGIGGTRLAFNQARDYACRTLLPYNPSIGQCTPLNGMIWIS